MIHYKFLDFNENVTQQRTVNIIIIQQKYF